MDPGVRLRQRFVADQQLAMRRALAAQRRRRIYGGIAGGIAGIVSVALAAAATNTKIVWHSFVIEAVLCTVAGYCLARRGGGMLMGCLYFALAYWLAYYIRAAGYYGAPVFAPTDLYAAMAGQGRLLSLGIVLGLGGVLGLVMRD